MTEERERQLRDIHDRINNIDIDEPGGWFAVEALENMAQTEEEERFLFDMEEILMRRHNLTKEELKIAFPTWTVDALLDRHVPTVKVTTA
jgi:hypothetical protein